MVSLNGALKALRRCRQIKRFPFNVTLLASESLSPGNGPAMASALAAIAAAGGPNGITDPVEWQRESRADRPLPGRTG